MEVVEYAYCQSVTGARETLEVHDKELEGSGAMSKGFTVIDRGQAKLILKVYTGEARSRLERSLSLVIDANKRLVLYNAPGYSVEKAAIRLVERGLAPVIMVCRGIVRTENDKVEMLGLISPYVESTTSILKLAVDTITDGNSEGLDVDIVRSHVCGTLRTVKLLHSLGVVHGDLRPANILVKDNRPVIIDFDGAVAADHWPVFMLNLEESDLPGFDRITMDVLREYGEKFGRFAIDAIGFLYTAALLAYASKPVLSIVRSSNKSGIEDDEVAKAVREVIGETLTEQIIALLKGNWKYVPFSDLIGKVEGEGVCK